ncbi:MAG: polymer-forming cytoskeletal protein [Timaviella obliquedivisa GSE-PSE-MK23-08B]|nr:polymer-forming cytoskeletal protein [Timaviella obliquedivisa GSE-PSE-MK23-08B]
MFGRKKTSSSLTYLNATSEIQGNLNVEGDLRVDGVVHGTVHVKGDMELSQTGLIEGAELKAHNLIIHGVVKARVVAEGRLTLSKTARLEGDVTAQSLDIQIGACYSGHIDTALDEMRALPTASTRFPELMGQEDSVRN